MLPWPCGPRACLSTLATRECVVRIDTLRERAADRRPAPFLLGVRARLQIPLRYYLRLLEEFDLVAWTASPRLTGAGALTIVAARVVPVPDMENAGLHLGGAPPGAGGRIFHVSIAPIPISSSEIRSLAASGSSLDELVPAAVARYIENTGLYREEERR